ncbi:orotidine 5'-phosphate decarboxylase [Recurvomyces mirabilis]|uniref:Orotidine 5'-phosphate decarboxylase n=1 Tax=Recurvomyces mirabilis TaxID=574656 RepID=A0AAE0WT18_9PEZI|nr:orotidine 5'-phosphate decarboxylase [Recurvomyces mirabilis]KAK5159437.1 orotidine 5'-phosphate decarboxylase [Recurvomyces mirabilis]
MTSLSTKSYSTRGEQHAHPLARRLFDIAEAKQSNLVLSADFTDSKSLLQAADSLGPYLAVFKTHVDLVSDFDSSTVKGLNELAKKHNFLIFEDRKLVDIGSTVQKQYHGGVLHISEFAHLVNLSILGGDGIVDALTQTVNAPNFPYPGERAFLILAEMTSKGSIAVGSYTEKCIELARKNPKSMLGFVATRALSDLLPSAGIAGEDFIVFTTGVNIASKGDNLGQQYQTPSDAVARGADFIIAGRGIYASEDPTKTAQEYRQAGWNAYLTRVGQST